MLKVRFDDFSYQIGSELYIRYECIKAGAVFKGIRPLKECPRNA